jgi:hypothetical protein
MIASAKTYRDYLQAVAENHPSLLHSDAEGHRVFAMMHVEEVVGDLRSAAQEKSFLMRGLHYTYAVSDNGDGRRSIEAGFMVAKYYSLTEGGTAAFLEALDDAERVTNDIIRQIILDSRAGHPLFFHTLDSDQGFQVVPRPTVSDSYAGWICTFRFKNFFEACQEGEDVLPWWNFAETYASDEAAGNAGITLGSFYELSADNIYGIPTGNGGIMKKRIQ